jgi:hypothetical protein
MLKYIVSNLIIRAFEIKIGLKGVLISFKYLVYRKEQYLDV